MPRNHLTSGSDKYFMIVSKDVLNYQTINMKFYGIQVAEVTPLKSHVDNDPEVFSNQPINRILIPGGYRIFKYKT